VVFRALQSLFKGGGPKEPSDGGLYYYVRCGKCGEAIRVRVDRNNDLAQEFEGGGDHPSGYTATKGVVGKKCFRQMSLTISFDSGRREVSRSIDGGDFITREQFEAAQAEQPDATTTPAPGDSAG
jgi:hypothetical protein